MNRAFNLKNRDKRLLHSSGLHYDLIVIGGGITGAGIALDAVSRGLKTLLIEKSDFASGTSSKSTKLIHGGLRYLKQFEIGLVRQTGRERAIVHKLAPHIVHPEDMLLPIVKNGSFSKLTASLAITVYDFLAGVEKEDRKKSLGRMRAMEAEPLLRKDILKSAILYSEYRTDDARLTFEIIKKAHDLGADIFNYCKVTDLSYIDEKVDGVHAMDYVGGQSYHFRSNYVISAAGPWVDRMRKKDDSLKGKHLRLTKGTHLVFDHDKLPIRQAIYFDDFNGRMLFAIPRLGVTYVGTTDTDYKKDINRVICDDSDVRYILDATNAMFDIPVLRREDVISSWAGLRPLIAEEGKSASELSRKDEIFESSSGLLSIAGGKLTGYRKMAERIVDIVMDRVESLKHKDCQTNKLKLTDDPYGSYEDVLQYKRNIMDRFPEFVSSEIQASYLVSNYGKKTEEILEASEILLVNEKDADTALIRTEIEYCLENESCFLPEDFYSRRTGMLYFMPHRLEKHFELICQLFRDYYNWDDNDYERIKSNSKQYMADSMINLK